MEAHLPDQGHRGGHDQRGQDRDLQRDDGPGRAEEREDGDAGGDAQGREGQRDGALLAFAQVMVGVAALPDAEVDDHGRDDGGEHHREQAPADPVGHAGGRFPVAPLAPEPPSLRSPR